MDPSAITMVDSVKVYVKTKEVFGWPEEPEDFPEPSAPPAVKATASSNGASAAETENAPAAPLPMTASDKYVPSLNFFPVGTVTLTQSDCF